MKIKVFPVDDGACGNYRIIWPAQALIADGHDIELHPTYEGRSGLGVMVNPDGTVGGIRHPDCDVLVLQRPTHRLYAQSIPFYRRAGVRVVVEIDDDLSHIPASNTAFLASHPRKNVEDNVHWLHEACRAADTVVCTTPTLAATFGGPKAVVVANYVPSRYSTFRQPPGHTDPVRVGWAGNLEVHREDLTVTRLGVANALRGTQAAFLLIGVDEHADEVRRELNLDRSVPLEATGWFELEDYPKGLAMLDIGLVPLMPNVFNEAKSWLKGLEYAAVGVPFVASDTEPYRALAALGIGDVAPRPKDWTRALRRLITDPSYRQDRADTSFAGAQELTVEKNAWRFHQAWAGTS